ncbi:MAG: tyrosine-type recombinase/integrase [Planctomycetota bacterium]
MRYLSQDEEGRLMNALPEWLTPIVSIARETELRLSNIINLEWSQVNIFSRMINLERTRNGEPHSVPMTEKKVSMYLATARTVNLLTGVVLVSHSGKRAGKQKLKTSGFTI